MPLDFIPIPAVTNDRVNCKFHNRFGVVMTIENHMRGHVLTLFEQFAQMSKHKASTIGQLYHGNGRLHAQFADETKSFTVRTYQRTLARFVTIWPAGVDWPEGIPRLDESTLPNMPPLPAARSGDPQADELMRLRAENARLREAIDGQPADDPADHA